MQLPSIEDLLNYKNPAVLKLYAQNYQKNKLLPEQAFAEVLKYLWLTTKHTIEQQHNPDNSTLPASCVMLRSMQEIDQMWHEFILFTQDYTDFCQKYFGEYIHHLPNLFDTMPASAEEVAEEISKLLPYVYDNLGEDTMRIWFASYL